MTGLRSYGDPCGIARALDVIGERWSLLIVRELLFGPKRFTDIRGALGASPNVVSQRLGELEASGVVQRRSAGGALYELSDWGRRLHPILLELGRWGAASGQQPRGELSVDALLVALEATFVAKQAANQSATFELRLGQALFFVEVVDGTLAVARDSPRPADAVIETDPTTLRALVFGDRKLPDSGVKLRGNARLAKMFFRMFARP